MGKELSMIRPTLLAVDDWYWLETVTYAHTN